MGSSAWDIVSAQLKMGVGKKKKKVVCGTFLVVQWLKLHLPVQGAQVQSLVRELRSSMLPGQNIKQKPYYNKFNKDFKKIVDIKK